MLLDTMTAAETNSRYIVIGSARRSEPAKTIANHQRSPWFGVSPTDEQPVQNYADRLLRAKLKM